MRVGGRWAGRDFGFPACLFFGLIATAALLVTWGGGLVILLLIPAVAFGLVGLGEASRSRKARWLLWFLAMVLTAVGVLATLFLWAPSV